MQHEILNTPNLEQGISLSRDAFRRLRKNKMAMFGLFALLFFIVIALLAPWISPYTYEVKI